MLFDNVIMSYMFKLLATRMLKRNACLNLNDMFTARAIQ